MTRARKPTDCLDLDNFSLALLLPDTGHATLPKLALVFTETNMTTHLLQLGPVLLRRIFALGLVLKRQVRELVLVLVVHPVLHVLEDRVKVLDALAGQQAQVGNHAGDGADGVRAAREADEDDLVAVAVVGAQEAVDLADALRQAEAECAAGEGVEGVGARADARLVLDDLHTTVAALSAKTSRDAGHVRGDLEPAFGLEEGRLDVAALPGRMSAWDARGFRGR